MITEKQALELLDTWFGVCQNEYQIDEDDHAALALIKSYIKGVPALIKENDECKRLLHEISIGYTGQPLLDRVREAVDRIKKDEGTG